MAAASAGQHNSLMESLSRRIEDECFAWPFVESSSYGVELGLRVDREIGAFRQILSQ